MKPNSKEFKELQAKWYKKLKDKGFEDAENPENGLLKSFHSYKITNEPGDALVNEVKAEYYRMATHFFNDYKFKDNVEKFIWKHHSEGVSYRDIVVLIQDKYDLKYDKRKVNIIVNKLAKLMREKYKEEAYDF